MYKRQELNYRGLAEITTKESFFTNTVARMSGASLKDGKLQFPFRVGGTISSPIFSKGKGDQDVDAVPSPPSGKRAKPQGSPKS